MGQLITHRRLIGLCCAALFVPLCLPLLTGRVFTRDDMAAWHLPFRLLYQQALTSGQSILWAPAVRSGLYIHGEGEAGLAHPLHLLLYRMLPLGPAFNLEIITSYVAMLTGAALLLKRFGLPSEASWFGAMVIAFSGFNLFNLSHVNHIATIAHATWVLLAAYVLLTTDARDARAFAFALLAAIFGSQLLVGHPQYVWMTFLALGFMVLCLLRSGTPWPRVGWLGGALALGFMIGAVQLFPSLDFVRESKRAGWSQAQSLSFSLSPLNLVQLWSPFALRFRVAAPPDEAQIVHEFIVYNGAFCTIALAWLVMRWRELRRKGLLTALLVFAAVSLVLAMGRYAYVYAWLSRLPAISAFRAPARHLVLFHFALGGIAAIVFEDLVALARVRRQIDWRRLWPLAVPVALSVLITLLAAALASSSWASSHDLAFSSVVRAAPWAGLVIAMAALVTLAARGLTWAVPALIVLTAFDLGLWGYSYSYRWGPLQSVAELAAQAEVPPGSRPGDLIEPMSGVSAVNLPLFRGYRLATGYFGVETISVLDPADPLTQRLAGVSWRPVGTKWEAVSDPMPRARLVSVARRSSDIASDVHAIDIARTALVTASAPASADSLSGDPGIARVIADRAGSIAVDTDAAGRQLLVVTERFHDGWRAAVDGGIEQPAIRAYGDYLGCIVEPGHHVVQLTFAPASTRNGLRVTLAGVSLTGLAAILLWRA